MSERDVGQYSIAKAVRGMLTGEWKEAGLEREASAAAATKFSMSTKGLLIPYDVTARRDFNVTTAANEAAPLVAADLRTDLLVDILRNRLAIGRLGATMLYGLSANIDIPKKLTGTSLGFVTEIAALAETNITTGKISMSPKRIGGYIEYSKQAVIQSAIAVEPLLRRDILDQYALEVETAAFNGSGSGSNPRGLRNTSGVGLVVGGANGAQPNWGHIVGLETAVADVNCDPDVTSGYLLNTRARGWFKTQQKAANLPFIWDNGGTPLNGYRAEVSNLVPRNLTKGTAVGTCSNITFGCDWNSLIVGTFGAMELLIDETSQAVNGLNRLILNAFIDVGVRRAADFAMMEDAIAQ
jgi:HK97 family phage major capsid protein